MQKKYKLLKDCQIPRKDLRFTAGEVKTSLEWLEIFYPVELPSYYNKDNCDQYCDEYHSWFAPIPSHHSKEEIIAEVSPHNFYENGKCSVNAQFEIQEVTACMEKWETSLKEQLIEKIEQIHLHGEGQTNQQAVSQLMAQKELKSEISSLIRDFKAT